MNILLLGKLRIEVEHAESLFHRRRKAKSLSRGLEVSAIDPTNNARFWCINKNILGDVNEVGKVIPSPDIKWSKIHLSSPIEGSNLCIHLNASFVWYEKITYTKIMGQTVLTK